MTYVHCMCFNEIVDHYSGGGILQSVEMTFGSGDRHATDIVDRMDVNGRLP